MGFDTRTPRHGSRRARRSGPLAVLLGLVLGLTLLGSAAPVATAGLPRVAPPSVTLTAPTAARTGTDFRITTVVRRGVVGQQVTLQRRAGTRWARVDSARLPAGGQQQKTVVFRVRVAAPGTLAYRAVLTRRGSTAGATSRTVRVQVREPVVPVLVADIRSRTADEVSTVTYSGTLTDAPAGTQVQIQLARGAHPADSAWATAATAATSGEGRTRTFAGTVAIPVVRDGVVGAPQLNLRAVAAGQVTKMKSYLIGTHFEGRYEVYVDDNPEIVIQDTFYAIYDARTFRINHPETAPVQGRTDGWDMVQPDGMHYVATYHPAGRDCRPDPEGGDEICEDLPPYLTFLATWTEGEHRIRWQGRATRRY